MKSSDPSRGLAAGTLDGGYKTSAMTEEAGAMQSHGNWDLSAGWVIQNISRGQP